MADTIADYEAWKNTEKQAAAGRVNLILGSQTEKPDDVARDMRIASDFAKETGSPQPPMPMVREYRNEFERRLTEARNAPILTASPKLADWLHNPTNAAVARDSLEGLSWWETTFGAATNAASRGIQRLPMAYNQYLAQGTSQRATDASRGFGEILSDETAIRNADGKTIGSLPLPGAQQLLAAGTRYLGSRFSEAIGSQPAEVAAQFQERVGDIAKRIEETPMSPPGERFKAEIAKLKDIQETGDKASGFFKAAAADPAGLLAFLAETGVESVPMIGASVGVGLATRNPAAGATAMGLLSGSQEYGSAPAEFFKEKGLDISTPEGALKAVSDPDLMREAVKRGETRGLIVGLMDGLSGGIASKTLANNRLANMALQTVVQAAFGAGGEAGAQIASGQKFDIVDVIIEGLAEGVTAPVEVAGLGFTRLREEQAKAKDAAGRVAMFQELSGQSVASPLRNRMPEKFQEFVAEATKDGPVEHVYVPADQFVRYFQSVGVDPYALIENDLDGVTRADLDAAIAGGGDLQIPTSVYAAKIAGSPHDAFLMENMRFDPDQMTAREAAEFNERSQEVFEEAWEEAERSRQEDEASRSHEQEIFDTMVSELRVAGRSTEVATTEAALWPAFYRTMAERSGSTVEEMMQRYPLPKVQGALPQGMQLRDTDELNRTLAEARARKAVKDTRQGLLEFISEYGGIVDAGGELKARDAAVVKRGRGKKNLRLARDAAVQPDMVGGAAATGQRHGADDVAQAVIEAGFLADDPVVMQYQEALRTGGELPDITGPMWAAIDAELRGGEVKAGEAAPEVQRAAELDAIEEYLGTLGLSLADDDAVIKAAIGAADARAYAQNNDGQRGQIEIPGAGVGNGDTVIRLFETADLSTFVHESGHYFLTVMQDMAAKGEPGSAADLAAVKAWWRENAKAVAKDGGVTEADVIAAIDNGTTGDASRDIAVDVGMQEQWARAFEAYLMEGKSPSVELRTAFEKMRSWLVSVYRRLAGLNVAPSPELRAVFDRMLATDAEIAKAQSEAGGNTATFATAEQMGLSPEEYGRFLTLRTQAEDEAKSRLLRETMAPLQREREKWFRDEKAKVREEVEAEVNAYPMYRATEWMGNRRWLGETQPDELVDMRLSKDVLVERYGDGVLKTLPRGMQTIYTVEGGLDPDEAAGWFGFGSGDEMIRVMERAPKRTEAIAAEVDRVMNERHGDVLNDGSVEAEALDAVHTDKRGQWIAAELEAARKIVGEGVGLTAKEARASARETLSRMKVRDAMNANRFLSAERKAAEEAYRLAGTLTREGYWETRAKFMGTDAAGAPKPNAKQSDMVARLYAAKRRQLVNHALYMESRKVAEEVEKAESFVRKLGKASTRERIAGAGRRENAQIDYLSAIDEVLERYDFTKMSGTGEDRRGSLNAFVAAMTAAGRENELSIPDDVLMMSARAPYKTIPVEELRGVIATLKNLEHVASRWDKLIDAQQERAFQETIDGVLKAFDENMPVNPVGPVRTNAERRRKTGREYLNLILNATTLLRRIDGFKDQGTAHEAVKAPIDAAEARLILRKQKAAADLEALYSVYTKQERRAMAVRQHVPFLGYALSKWEMISIALNAGNEGNLNRLTDPKSPRRLTEDQVNAVLASLDARDADFIQASWDMIGSFRSDIEAREKRTTGTAPAWVEARPVEVGGKTLRGGYYPLKYDGELSSLARDDEANEITQSLRAGRFGKAQTASGHLKARADGAGGRAVELDMSVMHRHINKVIYDLELSEPVSNAWRIIQNSEVRAAFANAGRNADFEALETWLLDVGTGEVRSADIVGRNARMLKSNFTAAKLAGNLSTVLMQVTGMAQTMVVVGKKDFVKGVTASMRPGIQDEIVAKSAYMSTRRTTFNKDIYDMYNDPLTGPAMSRFEEAKTYIAGKLGFYLMTKTQWYIVDIPTWMAGYEQGLRRFGNDEAKAVAHADDIVKRAQASGIFSDQSAIQRGSVSRIARQSDVVRWFTALGSYMFAKFNVAYERSVKAKRTIADEGVSLKSATEALSWTIDMAFLFTLEAVLMGAIKGKLPGQGEEGDDEEGWLKYLAKETGLSIMGTMPGVRDAAGALQGFDSGGSYGGIIKDAAGLILGLAGLAKSAATEEDDFKIKTVKQIIAGTGLATGLPATQINRAVDAGWRQSEGQDVNPMEYLIGKMGKSKN